MLDCIILGLHGHWTRSDQTGFPLDLLDNLMVCEVNEPSGVVLALEDPCWPIRILPFTNTLSSPSYHIHFQEYVLPEPSCCPVAENGLGTELLSLKDLFLLFFYWKGGYTERREREEDLPSDDSLPK